MLERLQRIIMSCGNSRKSGMRSQDHANFRRNISIYALHFDKLGLSYTYIPKNACSTLKLSLAVANGNLLPHDDPHGRESDFVTHSFQPHLDAFKFIVLRDPFQRIVSAYLDKFCATEMQNFVTQEVINIFVAVRGVATNVAHQLLKEGFRPSFSEFIEYLSKTGDELINEHWRSQSSFFCFNNYDAIIRFEDMRDRLTFPGLPEVKLLENYKNAMADRGRLIKEIDDFKVIEGIADITGELLMKKITSDRIIPHYSLFFTKRKIIDAFQIRYADDISIYLESFGGKGRHDLFPK